MLPTDLLLPVNYKSFAFIDNKQNFNSHWDITWSFTFALTGVQHAFCTFLTTSEYILSAIPGNYYNILGTIGYNYEYLLTEDGNIILTEDGDPIIISNPIYDTSNFISIAFDSTGFFSLSNTATSICGTGAIPNSLVIGDFDNTILLNAALSSLSTDFFLVSGVPNYQTVRVRYANTGNKLCVDFRKDDSDEYTNLTTISLSGFDPEENSVLYPGFSFCSPISSSSITPSTLYLKNFHVQGNIDSPTYE